MSARERLEWTLALLDRASGPARRVARGLDAAAAAQMRMNRAGAAGARGSNPLDALGRASGQRHARTQARLGREMERLAQGTNGATAAGTNFGAAVGGAFMAVGAAALGAALAVGRITISLGESMVRAADWRNRTEGAFRVLTNAQDKPALVGQAFQRASQYANRFGLDVREVSRQMVQMTAAGFSQSEIPLFMQAAGDLGALEGPQAAERAITALRQIRSKGVTQMEEIRGQLADAGFNVGDFVQELGRARGIQGNASAVSRQVEALMTARRISSEEGSQAFLRVMQRRSGGRVGATLDTQSHGAEAAMNRLSNAWLLLQSNFARSPAFARIIGFIERMATALDPASAGAQRFSAQLDRFFGVLTGAAARIDPVAVFNGVVAAVGAIGSTLQRVYPYAQAWITGFYGPLARTLGVVTPLVGRFFGALFTGGGPSIDTIRGIATVFGALASVATVAIGVVVGAFGLLARVIAVPLTTLAAFWRGFVQTFGGVETTFVGIGSALIRGLIGGITAGASALWQSLRGLAGGVVSTVKGALGIRSPSRVFAELGGHVAGGFALGIERGTGDVAGVVGAMVGVPNVGAVGARAAANARGAGPLALTINVTAPDGADADEWGAMIASAVARELGTRTERVA